ncbi:hypothetical protein [Paraburkholderia sp. MM5384-R2]|uniref:hypothetical protein n=1 Tax=Paraburkholderia sp. MM5384-R2 TaxID=2723097 RepID=UPI001618440A|nr:hypothetical protein [Paraburkholderia sp. MM5384-R2]MBB5502230.1 hypothetical protein [Paraburkholderia sp. MM5384-R2]
MRTRSPSRATVARYSSLNNKKMAHTTAPQIAAPLTCRDHSRNHIQDSDANIARSLATNERETRFPDMGPKIRTLFFPAQMNDLGPLSGRNRHPAVSLTAVDDDSTELNGFETCLVCVNEWNRDFAAPCFIAHRHDSQGTIDTLSLSVTTMEVTAYPVKATAYLYNRSSAAYLGSLDLRYFGMCMPRTLLFDVAEHRLPISTQIEISFGVDGGGPPLIPRPPTITSVALGLVERQFDAQQSVRISIANP